MLGRNSATVIIITIAKMRTEKNCDCWPSRLDIPNSATIVLLSHVLIRSEDIYQIIKLLGNLEKDIALSLL
jgi:hypothetical protein